MSVHINLDDDKRDRLDDLADQFTNGNRTRMVEMLVGLFEESESLQESVDECSGSVDIESGYYSRSELVESVMISRDISRSFAYEVVAKMEDCWDLSDACERVAEVENLPSEVAQELGNSSLCYYYLPVDDDMDVFVGDFDELRSDIAENVEQLD